MHKKGRFGAYSDTPILGEYLLLKTFILPSHKKFNHHLKNKTLGTLVHEPEQLTSGPPPPPPRVFQNQEVVV